MAAIVTLGYCAWVWVDSKLYQAREARHFKQEQLLKDPLVASRPLSPAPAVPKEGAPIGRIEIPRIGVSVMIVEGVESRDLKRAIGHIPGTALPGEDGNIAIAGHRDTFFRPLRSIHHDDTITLSTLNGAYRYRVVFSKIVKPEDVQVVYPTGRDVLTLVTCFPFEYVGSAPERFIVRAERLPGHEKIAQLPLNEARE
jgi:sortase A